LTLAMAGVGGLSARAAATAPTLSWSQGGTTITAYGFGTLDAGAGATATQTFTLTNTGGMSSGTIWVTLTGSSAFTITAGTCSGRALGPKKSCSVTVEYTPTTNGESDSATLTATGEHASASLTLTGKGGVPNLTLSPGTCLGTCPAGGTKIYDYDFGLVSSATTTFTVTNSGIGTSEELIVAGCCHPNFTLSNDTCFNTGTETGVTLAPNGTCTFEIGFTAPAGCSSEGFNSGVVNVNGTDVTYINLVATAEC
jgi:hypothetical protein